MFSGAHSSSPSQIPNALLTTALVIGLNDHSLEGDFYSNSASVRGGHCSSVCTDHNGPLA